MSEVCWDESTDTAAILTYVPFYHFAIVLPIILLFQLIILFQSFYYHCYCITKQQSKSKYVSILFLTLQLSGILYNLSDFIKQVILCTLHPNWVFDKTLCGYFGYCDKLIPFIYEMTFLCILLFRLEHTFKKSAIKVKTEKIMSRSAVVIPPCIFMILFVIFLPEPCRMEWHPNDYNQEMSFCRIPYDHKIESEIVAIIGMAWIVIINIVFGFIFFCKLRMLAGDPSINEIMIKIVMLTLFAVVSTVINWTLFFTVSSIGDTFIWIDYFMNVLFIALMFKYNEIYYYILCGKCAKVARNMLNLQDTHFMTKELELNSTTPSPHSSENDLSIN